MPVSTASAAKQYLVAQIKAIPELNTVAITTAPPTEQEDLEPEMIYFDGTIRRSTRWLVLGGSPPPLDEDYELTLKIDVVQAGDDESAATDRCLTLVEQVESVIRADCSLGGLLVSTGDTSALSFGEQTISLTPHSDGWRAEASVPLLCHARI